jgi:Sec-independent protein translocase protein TatA
MGEITVILLLALIFLGPKKLPELASGLGRIIKDIRKATNDVKNEIQLDDAIRKPFEELRDAVTLPPEELKRRDQLKKDLEAARRKAETDLEILAATAKAAVDGNSLDEVKSTESAVAAAASSLPLPGMPAHVPPPFPGAGSGPHPATPVPPPFPGAGSGPHAVAPVPPPFHAPHAAHAPPGAGPVVAGVHNPPHTVPVAPNREHSSVKGLPVPPASRAPRPPVAATVPVPPPKPHAEKTVTTQFLSEADLIPPDAPPPLPPPIPGSTGKHGAAPPPAPTAVATPAGHAAETPAETGTPAAADGSPADKKDHVS